MNKRFFAIFLSTLIVLSTVVFSSVYYGDNVRHLSMTSGNAIKEKLIGFYETSSVDSRIYILFQVIIGITITILIIFLVTRKFHKEKILSKKQFMKKGSKISRTDLDILYDILKQKREISMYEVERIFKINSNIAIGWAKILENGDLAVIDYPRFGKPVLRLIEEDHILEEGQDGTRETKKDSGPEKENIPLGKKKTSHSKKKTKKVKLRKKTVKKVGKRKTSATKKTKKKGVKK